MTLLPHRTAYPGRVIVLDAGDLIQGSPFVLRDTDYFTPSWQIVPQEAADAVRAVFARRKEPPE